MYEAFLIILVFPFVLISVVLMRAITARVVTGKWPHQSDESQKIYRDLP